MDDNQKELLQAKHRLEEAQMNMSHKIEQCGRTN
jgi:hypothetical protein